MKKVLLILIVTLSFLFKGCSEIDIPFYISFEGITETNADSPTPIGELDETDWMSRYYYYSSDSDYVCLAVLPAFPNPTERYTTLRYLLPSNERIEIWLEDKFGNNELILNDTILASRFDIKIDLLYDQKDRKRKPGIYRLFFRVNSNDKIPLIKGDIQLK